MEEILETMEFPEESIESRIEGLQAEVKQMKWMIEENIRKIAEGDDVEGRTYLKAHLESEVASKTKEIKKLQKQLKSQNDQNS